MTRHFSDSTMQNWYNTMLTLAEDKRSELYHQGGEPRRGAGHRAAFWDGYSGKFTMHGPTRSPHVVPGTPSAACFAAGQDYAKRMNVGVIMVRKRHPKSGEGVPPPPMMDRTAVESRLGQYVANILVAPTPEMARREFEALRGAILLLLEATSYTGEECEKWIQRGREAVSEWTGRS